LLSPPTTALDGLRIVACHDDGAVLGLITRTLRAANCRVYEAFDGLACYELALAMPIQLLIVNSRLGEMDGPTLISHIRAELPHIAVLHVGPDPDRRLPPDLPKLAEPFSADQLLAAVCRLLPDDSKDTEAGGTGRSPESV
jgi:two-component system, cell cycle sensor histidine kinase and response regulator CckA